MSLTLFFKFMVTYYKWYRRAETAYFYITNYIRYDVYDSIKHFYPSKNTKMFQLTLSDLGTNFNFLISVCVCSGTEVYLVRE